VTQMSPPPVPIGPAGYYGQFAQRPRRWSVAAITAFILSFLGCVALPVPLALVLAIIGIINTSGGKLRGLGLAVAAIPISLLMGVLSLPLFAVVVMGSATMALVQQLPPTLTGATADTVAAARIIREFAADDFRNTVGEEDLRVWFDGILAEHGKLTRFNETRNPLQQSGPGAYELTLEGVFVNDTVPVVFEFSMASLWKFAIDDIEIDGQSPKKSAAAKPGDLKNAEELPKSEPEPAPGGTSP